MKNNKGLTLIELVVVVAIIGLLSSIISVALNTSRMRARDTRRVSDLKQMKSGLDIYYANGNGYPDKAVWDANVGKRMKCGTVDTLQIPTDPLSPYAYTYTSSGTSTTGCGGTVWNNFEIEFYIENKAKYYIMNLDGNIREKVSGTTVSFDQLLK